MREAPKLLVTCRSTSIEMCEHEIGDVIYPRDPSVRVERSKYSGLLLVYTYLSPEKAYAITSHREYGFVENIIPVNCVLEYPASSSVIRECLERIVKTRVVKVKVRSRGVRGISRELFKLVMGLLSGMGVVHDTRSRTCLYVEVVESSLYIGVGSCHPVFKASI